MDKSNRNYMLNLNVKFYKLKKLIKFYESDSGSFSHVQKSLYFKS